MMYRKGKRHNSLELLFIQIRFMDNSPHGFSPSVNLSVVIHLASLTTEPVDNFFTAYDTSTFKNKRWSLGPDEWDITHPIGKFLNLWMVSWRCELFSCSAFPSCLRICWLVIASRLCVYRLLALRQNLQREKVIYQISAFPGSGGH